MYDGGVLHLSDRIHAGGIDKIRYPDTPPCSSEGGSQAAAGTENADTVDLAASRRETEKAIVTPAEIASLFLKEPQTTEDKRTIIDSLIEEGTSDRKREKIHRRLEKYPEEALKMLQNNEITIVNRPLKFLNSNTAAGYHPELHTIHIGRGGYSDFFIDHPAVSSLFSGRLSRAVKAAVQCAFVASVAAFIGLPLSIAIPVIGGLALTPLPVLAVKKIRDRSIGNPLEHEVAHALDVSLGRSPSYRDRPLSDELLSNPAIKPYRYEKGYEPFSLKCQTVIDNFLACKNGRAGSQFVTDYASTRPEEYFAECVRVYLNEKREGSDAGREDLLKKDPTMYAFVEKLFSDLGNGEFDKARPGEIPEGSA
jgi:hypothetical protein